MLEVPYCKKWCLTGQIQSDPSDCHVLMECSWELGSHWTMKHPVWSCNSWIHIQMAIKILVKVPQLNNVSSKWFRENAMALKYDKHSEQYILSLPSHDRILCHFEIFSSSWHPTFAKHASKDLSVMSAIGPASRVLGPDTEVASPTHI